MSEKIEAKELRIVLDAEATSAYEGMVERMRAEATIKVQPSYFVSFLMADFFATHFEKDKAVLIAEFFDSDAFYEAARRRAKSSEDFEELMAAALEEAKRIKGKRRRKVVRKGRQEEGGVLAP